MLADCDLLVLYNAKFDLRWLARYGIHPPITCKIWDCQLFDFIASNQRWIYPSLEDSCGRRGIAGKSKEIEEVWNSGVDTVDIPWPMVADRVRSDVAITKSLYMAQAEEIKSWSVGKQNLFKLHCADLLVLAEIETNGLKYDTDKSKEEAESAKSRMANLEVSIKKLVGCDKINLNSVDHKSAMLYGGNISFRVGTPAGVWKSGAKEGQPRFRYHEEIVTFPRLIEPLEKTGLAKEGFFSTDQDILSELKGKGKGKKLVQMLQDRAELNTQITKYLEGLPKIIEKMDWPEGMIHGTINQCRAVTGRTSSSKPNLQNMDKSFKHLFVTRF